MGANMDFLTEVWFVKAVIITAGLVFFTLLFCKALEYLNKGNDGT
jgi:hypothetical protein